MQVRMCDTPAFPSVPRGTVKPAHRVAVDLRVDVDLSSKAKEGGIGGRGRVFVWDACTRACGGPAVEGPRARCARARYE
jgi:hypothetical protein